MSRRIFVVLCCMVLALIAGPAAAKDLQVGFIYVSPVGDAGWSYAHDQGRLFIDKLDGVTTSYVEAVPEGPDSERVMLNMARKNYDLIFATSFGYMDPMLKVAQKFPKTIFMHCSGFKTAPNMGNYFGRMYQARYLSGMVAGAMTKSKIIGYVAAFPIPEVIRGINSSYIHAKKANPDVEMNVIWLFTWFDPSKEADATQALLDQGVDVVLAHTDSTAPLSKLQEAGEGVYGFGQAAADGRLAGTHETAEDDVGRRRHRAASGGASSRSRSSASGGASPHQISSASRAWAASRSRPSRQRRPASRQAVAKAVGRGP